MRQALLVVSFGTCHLGTLHKAIMAIETALGNAFPTHTLYRAFTSSIIRRKLAQEGMLVDDVPTALEKLQAQGYEEVLIQPTYLIQGDEFDKMVAQVQVFREEFHRIDIGAPMIATRKDREETLTALLSVLPRKQEDTAILFMGHGIHQTVNEVYIHLDDGFQALGREDVLVGTVKGHPELNQLINRLKKRPWVKRILLYPLMIVAGNHAEQDMAGDGPLSWSSQLRGQGYEVECRLNGMGEYTAIQDIFVRHAKEICCDR